EAHAQSWVEIPARYGPQGEVDLGSDPFYISADFYITDAWGFGSEYPWTTPYNFFKFYSVCCGPDGAHDGWFIREYFIWFEAIVKYYENTPPTYRNLSRQNWTYDPGPFAISVDIEDIDAENPGNAGIASAHLVYDINGIVDSTLMSGPIGGGTFTGNIPNISVGDTVAYYVSAFDFPGLHSTSTSYTFGRIEPEHPNADVLLVNDNMWAPTVCQEAISAAGCEYEYWDIGEFGGIDESVINWGWKTIVVAGNACRNSLPGPDYSGNLFVEWLELGTVQESHTLFYTDQDYFCAHEEYTCSWDEELHPGEFLYDYFGVSFPISDNHGAGEGDYDSVAVGMPGDPISRDFVGGINFQPAVLTENTSLWNWPDWIVDWTQEAVGIFKYRDSQFGAGLRLDMGHYKTVFLPWLFDGVSDTSGGEIHPRPEAVLLMGNILNWFGTGCDGFATEAIFAVIDTCGDPGETGVLVQVTLDNSAIDDVMGFQFDLYFDKSALTVTDVTKTERLQEWEIFDFNHTESGIRVVAVGIDHSLTGTTGPIADVTFDVDAGASGNYALTIADELVSDPLGQIYPTSVINGVFSVPCGLPGEEAVLAIGDTCGDAGGTTVLQITLDNSTVGEVVAGEMVIGFDKSVFTVTAVAKTDRSQEIDIFMYDEVDEGIKFLFVGIGHSIAPDTGSIADITVDVAAGAPEGDYDWTQSETILAGSMGTAIPHTTVDGVFRIPCTGIAAMLSCGDFYQGTEVDVPIIIDMTGM
ncbi:MAG: cohesin domain-containing protein, partial [bacterium]